MKISIIIPTLNEKNNIRDCIRSLSKQDCELIIVDGGSTDKTGDYIKKAWKKRVKFYLKKGNVSVGRNYGVRKATGEWIVFIDADSRAEPNFIKKLKKRINKHPNADGFRIRYTYSKKDGWLSRTWGLDEATPSEEADVNPNIFRKSIFPFYNEKLGFAEDRELWKRLEKMKLNFIACPEILQTHASKKNLKEVEKHMNWYGKYHSYPTFLWVFLVIPKSFLKVPVKLWRMHDPYAILIPVKDLLRLYYQLKISLEPFLRLILYLLLLPIFVMLVLILWVFDDENSMY